MNIIFFGNDDHFEEIIFDSKKSTSFPLFKDLNQELTPTIQTFFTLSSFKQIIMKHECINTDCFHCEIRKLFELAFVETEYLSCGAFQNFIENHSIQLKGCEGIEAFLSLIHRSSKSKCHPKCELHQAFPIFKRELSCDCGGFYGTLANDMLTSIEIPLSKLVKPFYSKINEFVNSSIGFGAEISTLIKLRFQFAHVIKNTFQAKKPNFFKCPGPQNHAPSFNIKSNTIDPSLLILKFNWNNVEQNTFNAMQSLIWLDGQFNLSEFSSCPPSNNLGLKTIFLTKKNKGKIISFIDNSWYKLSAKRNFQIYKGKWFDTLLYIISHRYMPLYIFYEKNDLPPIIILESIKIGLIERISYKAELGEDFNHQINRAYGFLGYENQLSNLTIECLYCHTTKTIGEACDNCGFINGDWDCSKCLEFNKKQLWTCRKCRADRINSDFDYNCEKCLKTSVNINYCKYCPSTMCFICEKEMFSYEEIFCTVCKCNTVPAYGCALENHSVFCIACKSLAE
ncbi:hypothetical protein SteCoe_15805 [Stentor coeruleus]|uniref:RanBP2-type domain-containing protein n=1 Tax=Stentor coeruleus TaxID=5963 RepID=A0A1R2C2T1_9CILI|nr:hypothetical protein SteCoe_15805 [Stentor coeruleus]